MVRMAGNVIASMHIGQAGARATKREMENALIEEGYGKVKAKRWVEDLIETGKIYAVASDPIYGHELFTTVWWTAYTMPPRRRIKRPRIDADQLTEEECAILQKVAE